jgi:3-hydroxy acid dehydrogenase / malonic semialdehyde reductase
MEFGSKNQRAPSCVPASGPSDKVSWFEPGIGEMSKNLTGKSVLVTGASAGIGRACVMALVDAGATVIATGRRKAELDALAKQCGAKVQVVAGDLNDAKFVAELAARAKDVDIMVNNAGVLTYAPLMDTSFDDTEAMFRTNVLASFRIVQAVARSMIARKRGHFIMMSSIAAREVYRLGVIYCATKHALSAITRGLRLELQGHGIKVTEIAPGMVDTDIRNTSSHPDVQAAVQARKYEPLTPQEVAEAVVFAAQSPPNCGTDLIELRPLGAA